MFHYDRGVKLTAIDLALDVTRRQPRGFISHAHADHFGRHAWCFTTPPTARLLTARFGYTPRRCWEYDEPWRWGSLTLRLYPAGHVLGSAMLFARDEESGRSLLYTGDVQLAASRTAERAAPPQADCLLTECTYGEPRFVFPERSVVEQRLVEIVGNCLDLGRTPVIHAYALGKAQEAAKILADHGFAAAHHPEIYRVSRIYSECGVNLGDYCEYVGGGLDRRVLLMPPPGQRVAGAALPTKRLTIGLTGWALCEEARRRWPTDCVLPLSDHADFSQLLELVNRVQPTEVVCMHGPAEFAEHLRKRQWRASAINDASPRPNPDGP